MLHRAGGQVVTNTLVRSAPPRDSDFARTPEPADAENAVNIPSTGFHPYTEVVVVVVKIIS